MPFGFLRVSFPTVPSYGATLDLTKRYVISRRRALGWFLGQISRTVALQTSHIYYL